MTGEELIKLLKEGKVKKFNQYREDTNHKIIDLTNADLIGANLNNANLSNANLNNANLTDASLRGANLSNANLSNANLSNANLTDASLSYASLRSADLSNANLNNANLTDAYLRSVTLYNADLSNANLKWADLSNAKGLFNKEDFLNQFEETEEGIIVYKTFNLLYRPNENWKIEKNSIIEENVNYLDTNDCGCGINVATLDWAKKYNENLPIWKCLIKWKWLMLTCIPLNTDGKFRCGKLQLLEII